MAAIQTLYIRMDTHAALAAGNAVEGTGVRCELEGTAIDILGGVYCGLMVRLASAVADTVTFRVYDSASTAPATAGLPLHEFSVAFDAQFDPWPAFVTLPRPFYLGLVVTAEAAGGAGRTVDVTPVVMPLPGRRASA